MHRHDLTTVRWQKRFDEPFSKRLLRPRRHCAKRWRREQPAAPPAEPPYDELARQIGDAAYRTTDAQVATVRTALGSEKAAFEVILAAAVGAGLLRWRLAMQALAEANARDCCTRLQEPLYFNSYETQLGSADPHIGIQMEFVVRAPGDDARTDLTSLLSRRP